MEKQMKTLKQTMLYAQKYNIEDANSSWFGCDTCHIWKKEVNTLKDKLSKAL